ncbi:Fe-S cluster assembly ATPase SufC [bacterium]|nr:Fe-S cluster assembly ATPase SufC [bacterium]
MLEIKNLHATVHGKDILKGINLTVKPGETHAIMGPNGSGKSTLSHVIAGRDGYKVTEGDILWNGESLLEKNVAERAHEGVFLAFQYPVEIPGVTSMTFLKSAVNAVKRAREEEELDAFAFMKLVKQAAKDLGMDEAMLKRAVNVGFSGGEKKRFDILQMALLQPTLAILDETDSGLDVDALRTVSEGVNRLRSPERAFVVITHYQRLLSLIVPDQVHVLAGGQIIASGDKNLALEIEEKGYRMFGITGEAAA